MSETQGTGKIVLGNESLNQQVTFRASVPQPPLPTRRDHPSDLTEICMCLDNNITRALEGKVVINAEAT